MRIAICDDNVADRKQTERLMGREAAWWIEQGNPMYMDSYGNAEPMLATPMVFDAFLIDVCHTVGVSALSIVEKLREKGVTAPIILCISDVNYHQQDCPEDLLFLDKPILAAKLHEMMVHVNNLHKAQIPQIELRTTTDTVYVPAEDIMYAEAMDSFGGYTRVTLADGRILQVNGGVAALFGEIKGEHTNFVMCSPANIVNILFVDRFRMRHVIMKDDAIFPIRHDVKKYVRLLLQWMAEHPGVMPTYKDIEEI